MVEQAPIMTIPICVYCGKRPHELEEYTKAAAELEMSPDDYVRLEEGTYNHANGHFACTDCYIEIGQPSSRSGWVAP